ncbi:MAG: polysaccharide deacetylase family protein [bacterium]|nr:polysaccharide deacetylase family protein [bacterium]
MSQKVYLAFSQDTEFAIPEILPSHIISPEIYKKLDIPAKRELWACYIREGIWSDPLHLARSMQELDMIQRLGQLFEKFGGKFTSFILGQWLEFIVQELGQKTVQYFFNSPAIDVQSHSFTHRTWMSTGDAMRDKISPPVPPNKFFQEIQSSINIIWEYLEKKVIGIRTPMGNIAPFSESEKHILEALKRCEIRFVSGYLKTKQRESNGLHAQPFFYEQLGFPNILEIPGIGNFDVWHCQPTRLLVFEKDDTVSLEYMIKYYLDLLLEALAAKAKKIFIPLVCHPHAAVLYDPNLEFYTAILQFCKENDIGIISYAEVNEMMRQ